MPAQPLVAIPLSYWLAFIGAVTVLLVLDLTVFHRHAKAPTVRQSALWTAVWCGLALAFNVGIYFIYYQVTGGNSAVAKDSALDFLFGYVVEWTLSMDNVFMFAVIFVYFAVPNKYQYRVLFWGILAAVIMRLIFIVVGTELIERANWILVLFGLFLVYTGIKLLAKGEEEEDPTNNWFVRLCRRALPIASGDHGDRFFVRQAGKLLITPLFLVLLVVNFFDVVFALDSVPAIFGITKDAFIVFTSNICAILGLRALYFLLAGVMDMFRYLNVGLSAILIFIGLKMIVKTTEELQHEAWWPAPGQEWLHWPLPDWASFLIVIGLLGAAILASVLHGPEKKEHVEQKA
ncbi:MAG: TerC family protein [Pirellulales bacterium]|nr:TerC family protein [Pirellulales bacterium]